MPSPHGHYAISDSTPREHLPRGEKVEPDANESPVVTAKR